MREAKMAWAMLQRCTCQEAGERLSEYLDGELGVADRARMDLHLASCPRCAALAADLARTIRAIHSAAGWVGGRPAGKKN
jgi:anti-sigma factor RsiW